MCVPGIEQKQSERRTQCLQSDQEFAAHGGMHHPTSLLSEDHFATYDDEHGDLLYRDEDYAGGEGLQSVVGVVDRGELGAIFETRGDLGPDHFEALQSTESSAPGQPHSKPQCRLHRSQHKPTVVSSIG